MIRISERGGNEAPTGNDQLLIQVTLTTKKRGNIFFRYRNRWESIWQYLANVVSNSSSLKVKWKNDSLEVNLKPTGVVAGSYTNTDLTVDEDGRIISASNGTGGTGSSDASKLYLYNNFI